jgi:hypothetical protein
VNDFKIIDELAFKLGKEKSLNDLNEFQKVYHKKQ